MLLATRFICELPRDGRRSTAASQVLGRGRSSGQPVRFSGPACGSHAVAGRKPAWFWFPCGVDIGMFRRGAAGRLLSGPHRRHPRRGSSRHRHRRHGRNRMASSRFEQDSKYGRGFIWSDSPHTGDIQTCYLLAAQPWCTVGASFQLETSRWCVVSASGPKQE